MNSCDINLRVIKMEYNIPTIQMDIRKRDAASKREEGRANINVILAKTAIAKNKHKTVPEAKINDFIPPCPGTLVEDLLAEIYGCREEKGLGRFEGRGVDSEACTSTTSELTQLLCEGDLRKMCFLEMSDLLVTLQSRSQQLGVQLGRRLCARDTLRRKRRRLCSALSAALRRTQTLQGEDAEMRFSVSPRGGASGWAEWLRAMRLVARLPAGVPQEFRRKLWLTLAEQHLKVKGVDWSKAEKTCFSEWTNPDDTELGVQIVKDLHRTGCSLFCGSEGRENQAVLKRVLLAYARWNKAVGYCQGFNMLAALILEVMDRSESDSLKVMIYLIEAVLPEGYFANNLRGLSVDMAVFRDLLRLRLPRLSAHLDKLQKGAAEGSVYEPPLTNVFTMQWFLTLFCNCLPHDTVLRVWDLAFLEGDAVLLTTALAIWDTLQDRILKVDSADEFYSVMGELARETLEAPPGKGEQLLASAARLGPVPELPRLRDKHRYNIAPWAQTVQSAAKKGLRLFYSEDETDSSDDGDKLALTAAYGLQSGGSGSGSGRGRGALMAAGVFGHPDRERLALDISALKQQYERLRERQRQAHIILAAACARQPHVGASSPPGPMSMNHLLLGKRAIVSNRGRRLGPPQGAVPPSRVPKPPKNPAKTPTKPKSETLHWKDENSKKVTSRRDSIKWKDVKPPASLSEEGDEEDPEEVGKQLSDSELNEIMKTSMRSRRKSESSSYSECSESSTSTSLCDEPNRMSDFDSEAQSNSDNNAAGDDDTTFDSGAEREGTDDCRSDTEQLIKSEDKASTSEFGTYVQECEDLLDRTNNIECDRGLICVIPDEKVVIIEDKVTAVGKTTLEEIFTIKQNNDFLNKVHLDDTVTAQNKIAVDDYVTIEEKLNLEDLVSFGDKPTVKDIVSFEKKASVESKASFEDRVNSVEKTFVENEVTFEGNAICDSKFTSEDEVNSEEITNINSPKNNNSIIDTNEKPMETNNDMDYKFDDFFDSNRGKQLRSYLNEFKIADHTKKSENTKDTEGPDLPDIFQPLKSVTSGSVDGFHSDENEMLEIGNISKNVDTDDNVRTISSIEYHSTSCDRSISSSMSSISPLPRSTPGFLEDKATFLSYKSPCRDSDVPSEFIEDEKPLVLRIDKYFEHSPEFFGARKSGSHLSSDEDDDKLIKKKKNEIFCAMKSEQTSKERSHSDFKPSNLLQRKKTNEWVHTSHEESDDVFYSTVNKYDDLNKHTFNNSKYGKTKSPLIQPESSVPVFYLPETSRHRRISSLDSPQSIKYLIKQETIEPAHTDEYTLMKNEHIKLGLLEKTKSEDLSRDQHKRSFSVLDDEIEAIRSQSGRRNSERALKIIQENSKILHRILVNQVNKCSMRDSLQEESAEDINDAIEKTFKFPNSRNQKYLSSPRSASLDDHLSKTNNLNPLPHADSYAAGIVKSPIQQTLRSPLTSGERGEMTQFQNTTDKKYTPIRPKSFESRIFSERSLTTERKTLFYAEATEPVAKAKRVDENKTDMFGWENKGFGVKQRKTSFKGEKSPSAPSNTENISEYVEPSKPSYSYDCRGDVYKSDISHASEHQERDQNSRQNDPTGTEVNLHLQPVVSFPESPALEKNSSLTAVSDTMLDLIDSSRDTAESHKIENNNTVTSTYNLSPQYKYSQRSSDASSYLLDGSFKNPKISDFSSAQVTDSFSRVTDCSPIDGNSRPEGLKFATSQSSDMFIISSSMSFSFEPSVEDQPSSKPGTFNSSDTLCQLTSLDQVSTPISPKATSYPTSKESLGISQRDLSMELDRFKLSSEEVSYKPNSYDTYSGCAASLRTPSSPTPSFDKRPPRSPDKDRQRAPMSPEKLYSPFPVRIVARQPKELGLRLGLYKDPVKSPSK